ncbi:MAG TPA: hypothetical protein DCP92_18760, partial [Nitrospiraceae bacterium]|nr:hypothetical protein [Nitrospiraceae bacterium]
MAQKPQSIESIKKETKPSLAAPAQESCEDIRTGTSPETLKQAILDNLNYVQGRIPKLATRNDWYMAVAYTVRDRMIDHFIRSLQELRRPEVKIASYLSAEFLMGPHLG